MATHSSILVWRIPWTEGPGGSQSMGWHRVRHDWSDLACTHTITTTERLVDKSLLMALCKLQGMTGWENNLSLGQGYSGPESGVTGSFRLTSNCPSEGCSHNLASLAHSGLRLTHSMCLVNHFIIEDFCVPPSPFCSRSQQTNTTDLQMFTFCV